MMGKSRNLTFSANRITRYFGFFMVIVYLTVGFLLIFSGDFFPILNQTTKLILGIVLVIYGIFRAYRAIKTSKHENTD